MVAPCKSNTAPTDSYTLPKFNLSLQLNAHTGYGKANHARVASISVKFDRFNLFKGKE